MNPTSAISALERLGARALPGRLALHRTGTNGLSGYGDHGSYLRDKTLDTLRAHTDDFGLQWTTLFDDYRHDRYTHLEQFMRLGIAPMQFAGATVLDAGMGLGRLSEILIGCADLVIGCDLSAAIETAARHIDNPRFIPVQASIANLPFADESIDFIFSWGVVHHCPDPVAALDDLWRVLKPGGTMAIWVYADTEGHRRRSYINWHLKDFTSEEMLNISGTLADLAHVLQLTSLVVAAMLKTELRVSARNSKQYTRHLLFDGLGPDFHHLITPEAFKTWALAHGTEALFSSGTPLGVTFTKAASRPLA